MRARLPHITADILARLRARAPRVHCITNAVAQAFTANTLLAAGAVPSMTLSADEIGAFVARADALLVNLGTFDEERREATAAALEVVEEKRKPWVLDPVFIDRSEPRAAYARSLIAQRPRAIRLNRAEFAALAGADADDAALTRYALDTLRRDGADGHDRPRHRRHAVGGDREWPSADGARDRDGMRRLRAGCGIPGGRKRSVRGECGGAVCVSVSQEGSQASARAGRAAFPLRCSMRCTHLMKRP